VSDEGIVPPHILDTQAELAFYAALGAVEMVTKTQTADTGKYTYTYADLGDVLDECKRACALFDLAIAQWPTVRDGYLTLCLNLIHSSGGRVIFDPLMMQLPKEAQAYGSALTYARRYQLLTVFGIAPEDDDGRAATTAAQTQPGRRTEAERMIREQVAQMDEPTRVAFQRDFKEEFRTTLTDLPANVHGRALTWAREWTPAAAPEPTEAEDPA
jgi:hypothetical protein